MLRGRLGWEKITPEGGGGDGLLHYTRNDKVKFGAGQSKLYGFIYTDYPCYYLYTMESPDRQELFDYYDARAQEYEEFYDGTTSRKIFAPALIREEVDNLKKLLHDYVKGRCIDIACGTGFWLPVYEKSCASITLIDQSENVLNECCRKIKDLKIEHKTKMFCGDIFSYPYAPQAYDSAVIAFLISHLTDDELDSLISGLKTLLAPDGRFVFMDNAWNQVIANIPREKTGIVTRTLKDGRQYRILKRYFEKQDFYSLADKHNLNREIIYWGNVFFMAIGYFGVR